MPIFEYQAIDANGQTINGTLLSGTLKEAADSLAHQGVNVVRLGHASTIGDPLSENRTRPTEGPGPQPGPPPTEARSKFMTDVAGPLFDRVAPHHLQFFFRQLATMLKAGVPIVQSLDTLSGQTSDPKLRGIVKELSGHTREGRQLSVGLQRYPEVFSPLILSLVRVGEKGGILSDTCDQIANYIEREIELRNIVRRVTIYPKLVLGASIFIILATNFIIASMGKSGGISSPLTTWGVWICLGPILIGLFLFFRVGLANPRVRYNWEQFVLYIPYFGTTVRQLAMAKFGRAFGALYAGGVPVPEALKLAADACGNEYMRAQLHPLHARLEEGAGLHQTFASAGVFSPIVLDMVHTGEQTGNVDFMLTKMSEFYEDEAKVRSVQAAYALGVVALVLVGIYVGYVVFTFYSGFANTYTDALNGNIGN